MKTTKLVAGLLMVCLLASGPTVLAAKKQKEQKLQQPISIEADELYFSDKTGEMFARGNVVITQEQNHIFADIVRGNDKQTEVWVDGPLRFQDPLTNLTGMKLNYNYGSRFGMMRELDGRCGDIFVSGKQADIADGKYTLYSSTATGCKMKGNPDYRVTARKIEIWPGDKMIAYDAKVWVKNTVIYSTPRYRKSLRQQDSDREFPQFGYYDRDGFYISQRVGAVLSDNVSVYTDLTYYTKAGFRPTFGVIDQEKDYTVQLVTGQYRDNNGNWIRKEPELWFGLRPRRIGKTPYQYTVNLIYGQWRDDFKTSWHQDLNFYVRRDPIYFDPDKTWRLDLGGGFGYVRESYNNSSQNMFKYSARLAKKISPALTAWTAYNYTGDNTSIFAYNKSDIAREGIIGLAWKINNRTTLSYRNSYDYVNKRVYDDYYTVHHSFHCWDVEVTYRSVKKSLEWTFTVARW